MSFLLPLELELGAMATMDESEPFNEKLRLF